MRNWTFRYTRHYFDELYTGKILFLQHYCKTLPSLYSYRPVVAAILLALYAFIATPVQYWHHHGVPASESGSAALKHGKIIHAGKGRCAVCAHQFADCEAYGFFCRKLAAPPRQQATCFCKIEINLAVTLACSNKGPPSSPLFNSHTFIATRTAGFT